MPWVFNPFTQKFDWTESPVPGAGTANTLQATDGAGALTAATGVTFAGAGRLNYSLGTITTAVGPMVITETRNASGVTFPGWVYNVTNTAAGTNSTFFDLQLNGASRLSVRTSDGSIQGWAQANLFGFVGVNVAGALLSASAVGFGGAVLFNGASTTRGLVIAADMPITWSTANSGVTDYSSLNGSVDCSLRRSAAGLLEVTSGPGGSANRRDLAARYFVTTPTTVASLGAASSAGAGARSFVTDANATTFAAIVAGGGSNGVPVYSDGTNWRIG